MSDTKLETENKQNNAEELSSENISSDGIRAVQGDTLPSNQASSQWVHNLPPGFHSIKGLSASELDVQNIKNVYPKDNLQVSTPQLNPADANDLDLAGQHAGMTKATRAHADTPKGVPVEYWRIRSEISEHFAQQNIINGLRADQLSQNGSNFPGYDVLGKDELCSVKVYGLEEIQRGEHKILQPRYDQYDKVFAHLISPESDQNTQAAKQLWELRNSGNWDDLEEHLPPDVVAAKTEVEMVQAISKNSTMRIPEDQVENVRVHLMERFGLTYEDASRRIRSIDERYTTAHYQLKAAEIWMHREQELASLRKRMGSE
jgi:hypothetical protein